MSDASKKVWRLVFALILLTILIGISMMLSLNKPAVPLTEESTETSNAVAAQPPTPAPTILPVAPLRSFASGTSVLSAIQDLESASDPKCHSTACRFEDFIYGTPLTDTARAEKVRLQKKLVADVWRRAARAATDAGEDTIARDRLAPVLKDIATIDRGDTGDGIVVRFATGEAVSISPVRVRQFSSIAYALRTMLAVGQDALMEGQALPPLAEPAITALRNHLDHVTVCALKLADETARRGDFHTIDRPTLCAVWDRLVGSPVADSTVAIAAEVGGQVVQQNLEMLLVMIRGKLAAYDAYNGLEPAVMYEQFWRNVESYFARYPLPETKEPMAQLEGKYFAHMLSFTEQLLMGAQRFAERVGKPLIRSADAVAAVQLLTPHEIDEFEDVQYFLKLPIPDQVTIESYDCDAFRDTGTHWECLEKIYRRHGSSLMIADPFAAEILSEAISGYGVLLLRIAGEFARLEQAAAQPALSAGHLALARRRIAALADRHVNTAPAENAASGIVSATTTGRKSSGLYFSDMTAVSGVDFVHRSSQWLGEFRRTANKPPTFSGGGVAAEDVNSDGHLDLLFVSGTGNALMVNDGTGHFDDMTAQAGLNFLRPDGSHGEARQGLIADFDNDGRQDILITYANDRHRLYRNLGGLRFEDLTAAVKLGGPGQIVGPATVFDFDGDGLLDIYMTYFGNYLLGAMPGSTRDNRNGTANRLFRNLGGLRFSDVTRGSGTGDTGWSQGVSHTDFDRDGRPDIVVANDFGRNAMLRNLGGGRFENMASRLGMTKAFHSMNVGITDLNRDGFPDIYVSNIATMVKDTKYVLPDSETPLNFDGDAMAQMLVQEANVLYMSVSAGGQLTAYEESTDVGRGDTSTGWAWDGEFFDFDNDGDDDLYVVNGANDYNLYYGIRSWEQAGKRVYRYFSNGSETNVFYENVGGKLRNRSAASGADFAGNSRGTAYVDWDDDGDVDIAVSNFHGAARLLRNDTRPGVYNWLKVKLIGDPTQGTSRDAIGARLTLTGANGLALLREIQGGSGYMSMNPKLQHFGLGAAAAADLEVVWPNGAVQSLPALTANQTVVIRQMDTKRQL